MRSSILSSVPYQTTHKRLGIWQRLMVALGPSLYAICQGQNEMKGRKDALEAVKMPKNDIK